MKLEELRENEPIEVIEVSKHAQIPPFGLKETSSNDTIEIKQIQKILFTDGEIFKESEEIIKPIEEFYIDNEKYQYGVDTLKTRNIYLKNYSYVIAYLIANEYTTVENVRGWFDIVKEVSIYLKDPNNRKALKKAQEVIEHIDYHNKSVDYSSLFKMLFSRIKVPKIFESEKITQNVYSLKRVK